MSNLRKFINSETLIKDEIYKNYEYSLCCAICSDILIEPTFCMNCQTVYCKTCIDDWTKKSNSCTNRCENPKFEKSILQQEILSKLKFICQSCDEVINYDDVKQHSLIKCTNESKLKLLRRSQTIDKHESVKSKYNIYLILYYLLL